MTADDAPASPAGRSVMMSRATSPRIEPCRFCKLPTARCLVWKLAADPAWDWFPACDPCFAFLQALRSIPSE